MPESVGKFLRRFGVLLLVAVLFGALVATEAGRQFHKRQAADYRELWQDEQRAHRRTVLNNRIAALEARITALATADAPPEYEERLAAVREQFRALQEAAGE